MIKKWRHEKGWFMYLLASLHNLELCLSYITPSNIKTDRYLKNLRIHYYFCFTNPKIVKPNAKLGSY